MFAWLDFARRVSLQVFFIVPRKRRETRRRRVEKERSYLVLAADANVLNKEIVVVGESHQWGRWGLMRYFSNR